MIRTSAVLGLVAVMAQPVLATYTSIEHNLLDGTGDTTYVGGVLSISQAIDTVTLNDPAPLPGIITNAVVSLSTTFSGFNPLANPPYGRASFSGGAFSLSFDYNGLPYSIGGPISGMLLGVGSTGPFLSTINGEGLFAAAYNLPGSNDWPATGLSSIHALTLQVGTDLSGFDWSTDWAAPGETLYTLTPDESAAPEPASLLMLVLGLAMLRRSR
jgi:hypothetical protein